MGVCPRCRGTGSVWTPGWFVVQLYECESWDSWLDFPTAQAAIARAEATGWGRKVRVLHGKRLVWHGINRS
jgi:hypothetical protein